MWLYLTLLTPVLALPALLFIDRLERWTTLAPPRAETRPPVRQGRAAGRPDAVAPSRPRSEGVTV